MTDSGRPLDEEISRLLTLPGLIGLLAEAPGTVQRELQKTTHKAEQAVRQEVSDRNAKFFAEEVEKLDGWAEDVKVGLERELQELDRQIKEARRAATAALTLQAKLDGQKRVRRWKRRGTRSGVPSSKRRTR